MLFKIIKQVKLKEYIEKTCFLRELEINYFFLVGFIKKIKLLILEEICHF